MISKIRAENPKVDLKKQTIPQTKPETFLHKNVLMDRSKYIKILEKEFSTRREKNIYYSLRQFALDLEVDFSHLGYVLRNERGFSRKKAESISRKLTHLNYSQRKEFLRLVSATSGRSRYERNLAKMGLKNEEILLRRKKRI